MKTFPPPVGLRRLRNLHTTNLRNISLHSTATEQAKFTTLMMAAMYSTPSLLKILIADGADVEAKNTILGRTALMWAVSQKNYPYVRALVASRADVNAKEFWG